MILRRLASLAMLTALLAASPFLLSLQATNKANSPDGGSSGVSIAASLGVSPDLDTRMARFQPFEMPFDRTGLNEREQKLVERLVDAANNIERIYWRQSDPEGLKLYVRLAKSTDSLDKKVLWFMKINGSRYDLVDELRPFVGRDPAPPGRGLYPTTLTQQYLEDIYLKLYPEQRDAMFNERSVLRLKALPGSRDVMGLNAIPYHLEFAEFLRPAAEDLREAAKLSDDPGFAKFLRMRAGALLNDDYYASDLAWLDLKDPKFDLILAPYETYLDNLLGVRTSYGAAVLIRNDAESKKLAVFQKYVPELQKSLPLAAEDLPAKLGHVTPMEVMDAPFRTGDLRHGYQAVADNLPNDARVHEAKGSKKIFFKNFMDARVNVVILPIAKRLFREDQAVRASGDGYLAATLAHEISHELGPNYARTPAGKKDIREAIGGDFSALEEAKADVVGMVCLKWLADHGAISKEQLDEDYISEVAGNFRTIRFGIAEPHGRGELMEFNYLMEKGAVTRDAATGRYEVVLDKMPGAFAALAKELLEQEATGDRARTAAWFAKYAVLPDYLRNTFAQVFDIPVDIQPIYSFQEEIR